MPPHSCRTLLAGIALGFILNSFCAASPPPISTDPTVIESGRKLFMQDCSACHNFDQDGIGPRLNGITSLVSADWIANFIRQPQAVIESGDARAKELFERYKVVMPAYDHYSDAEMAALLAYLHTYRQPPKASRAPERKGLADPIPEPIPLSDLIVDLEPVTVIPPSSDRRAFTRITKLATHPVTEELCVLDLRGKLYHFAEKQPVIYLDMAAHMPAFISRPGHATGFGSFAFHPEFSRNGLLYTTHTERPGSATADFAYDSSIPVTLQWVLSEWKTDRPGDPSFTGSRRELFRIDMINQTHGVQEIAFSPYAKPGTDDYGLLYIGIGDGGSAESRHFHLTQTPSKPWGTVIRIDPLGKNSANGRYGIPPTNPFAQASTPDALGEVYAYGFRNPHRLSWTRDGRLIVPDIGQHNIEALDLVLPGRNYGWPLREGTFLLKPEESFRAVHPLPADDERHGFLYPIAQYDHDEGNAIIGGYEYIGASLPALAGKYLFADMYNGRLFYIEMSEVRLGSQARIHEWRVRLNGRLTSFKELCGNGRLSLRFGQDHRGELYLFAMPDGKVYRLAPAR